MKPWSEAIPLRYSQRVEPRWLGARFALYCSLGLVAFVADVTDLARRAQGT
jgi:hypothetical protein